MQLNLIEMKKISYSIVFVCLVMALACSKQQPEKKRDLTPIEALIQALSLREHLNDEAKRVLHDISDPDFTFGVIDNLNFGRFGTATPPPIYLSGKTEPNVSVTIDNQSFGPAQNGDWFLREDDFKQFYGKMVDIEVEVNSQVYQAQRYIPFPIQVGDLSQNNSIYIAKTGNTLTWTVDPDDQIQTVVLYYTLFDNEDFGSVSGEYESDVLVLDNKGSFNLDQVIDEDISKRISFMVVNGNTFSFETGGHKYLFNMGAVDHHEYLLLD